MISYNAQRNCNRLTDYNQTKAIKSKVDGKNKMEIKAKMEKAQEFDKPHIEEGWYECECKEVKKVQDGQYGSRIAIVCTILEKEVELAKVVYLKLTEGSSATKVIEAFGFKFEEGNDFNFSNLEGMKATAVVEDYTSVKDGEEFTASTITKFKPSKSKEPKEEKIE